MRGEYDFTWFEAMRAMRGNHYPSAGRGGYSGSRHAVRSPIPPRLRQAVGKVGGVAARRRVAAAGGGGSVRTGGARGPGYAAREGRHGRAPACRARHRRPAGAGGDGPGCGATCSSPSACRGAPTATPHCRSTTARPSRKPYIVALMTQTLNLQPEGPGAGGGYRLRVPGRGPGRTGCRMCSRSKSGRCCTVQSTERLQRLGYDNVSTFEGDGYFGVEQHAPFDHIMITAAVDHIPAPLLEQLAVGVRR